MWWTNAWLDLVTGFGTAAYVLGQFYPGRVAEHRRQFGDSITWGALEIWTLYFEMTEPELCLGVRQFGAYIY